ncbi:hypothetical protein ILUMI_04677 [Ignelater luminosus]|uniref:Uncharacterized protein n=1 Tax=Ignelater luminosus TaxID=2038154 RepID=A0A8K0D8P6_IGNLU|nr:hypothetical protein ILUMI_04677 [Ignelater luminosus]
MEVNSPGTMSRTGSTRSSRKSSSSFEKASFSSERSSPVFSLKSPSVSFHYSQNLPTTHGSSQSIPKSPTSIHSIPKSPVYTQTAPRSPIYSPKSPNITQPGQKSPNFQRSPSSQTEKVFSFSQTSQKSESPTILKNDKVFDFPESSKIPYSGQKSSLTRSSPNLPPKSPKSPRNVGYSAESPTSPKTFSDPYTSSGNHFNFNIQPPPKQKLNKIITRQQYQASRNGSSSSKSSLEYVSTTKHPTGDYQSVEYKICNSAETDSHTSSDFHANPGYGFNSEFKRRTKHSSIKEKKPKKPPCNIRTNPGYDERYSSSKSINESGKEEKHIHRCRKSTSDLTDMTDDAGNTTITSLSRPSSPRRNGSIKGGLAYLASRRGSRDSVASNMSNVSNEDIGPLNFQNTVRGRQRRTSNFLELPGKCFYVLN